MLIRALGLTDPLDKAMDLAVLPGFSRIGYSLRRRMYQWTLPDLDGRHVMVTGANSGLGLAASIDLVRCGSKVHMVCRNEEKAEAAREQIVLETGVGGTGLEPELHICDLSVMSEIRRFAEDFLDSDAPLDVLINNAGVMPSERQHTPEGLELTFATNLLGPYLLTELLLPRLREGTDPRVITMSSGGMYSTGFSLRDPQLEEREFSPTGFYAHTKRGEVMLTDEWQSCEPEGGVTFCSMHPGWAVTPGMSAALPGFHRVTGPILRDSHEGVDTAVWLTGATSEEAPGGCFYQDRQPRTKQKIPGTQGTPEDAENLRKSLSRTASS